LQGSDPLHFHGSDPQLVLPACLVNGQDTAQGDSASVLKERAIDLDDVVTALAQPLRGRGARAREPVDEREGRRGRELRASERGGDVADVRAAVA
jgi:hypothetical protein